MIPLMLRKMFKALWKKQFVIVAFSIARPTEYEPQKMEARIHCFHSSKKTVTESNHFRFELMKTQLKLVILWAKSLIT